MKLSNITKTAGIFVAKSKFKLKKHSPEILLASGIAGLVGTAVLTYMEGTKAHKIAEKTNEALEEIERAKEISEVSDGNPYTEEDEKKDKIIVYTHMVVDYVKLFAPSVILCGLSIASLLTSHNIMRKRNLNLAASLAATSKLFDEYRGRVAAKYGEEAEKDIRYNASTIKAEDIVEDEKGNKKKVKSKKTVIDPTSLGLYSAVFDASNPNWQDTEEYNLNFIKLVEQQMTNRLRSVGHVFLNEVYDTLGIDRTEVGQYAGWVYDPDSDISDNYVDLGLYNGRRLDDYGNINIAIVLEPNCDGSIIDRVFKKGR